MYILNSFVLQFKYIEGLLNTKLYNNKMKKKQDMLIQFLFLDNVKTSSYNIFS